jgi:hypothetical protein
MYKFDLLGGFTFSRLAGMSCVSTEWPINSWQVVDARPYPGALIKEPRQTQWLRVVSAS